MGWFDKLENYLFKKDKKYMIKYINNNCNKITIDILFKLKIDKIVDNKNNIINIDDIAKKLIKVKKIIDETNDYIPLDYSIHPVQSDTYKLIDLLTGKNNTVPGDYISTIIDTINIYDDVITIFKEKEILIDDLDYEHNSKIINLYIINMDNIIQLLFNAINE
jgi:hypothetical protein